MFDRRLWGKHCNVEIPNFLKFSKVGQMRAFRDAAESICMGEMVSRQIWSSQNWSLLPLQVTKKRIKFTTSA